MLMVEQIEAIRRAYDHDHERVRAIGSEQRQDQWAVRAVIAGTASPPRRSPSSYAGPVPPSFQSRRSSTRSSKRTRPRHARSAIPPR